MKFRKKPVVIEAVEFLGIKDREAIFGLGDEDSSPDWLTNAIARGDVRTHPVWPENRLQVVTREDDPSAPEKSMIAEIGDFIICGVAGELYPCKPDIFAESYEAAE